MKDQQKKMDEFYSVAGDTPYLQVLETVQRYMTGVENTEEMDVWQYKKHIQTCITTRGLKCWGASTLSQLVDRLYNSMREYDLLTDYLTPEVYTRMGIEEIYGRWNCIYMKTKKGKIRLTETFPSAEHARAIFNRITSGYNQQINEGTPIALGEFRPNIRASFTGTPVTSKEMGIEFNIRIVHGSAMTRELLLESGTFHPRALDFLELCIRYGANICIAGATGSGKTGTMYYLLSTVARDATKRIGTIEIESREFDLLQLDENGVPLNDVFSWVTRSSDDSRYNIPANKLVETILRFTPDIIGLGEMRNEEALAVSELALTGHGAITTLHAASAQAAYSRIVDLCKKAGSSYNDATLFRRAIRAFPIIVFQERLADGRRRVLSIVEGVGYADEDADVKPLFRFEIEDNTAGKVLGKHVQTGQISRELRQTLLQHGASRKELEGF